MSAPPRASLDRVPRPVTDVATEIIEGEVLLYHPRYQTAVYLNPTAALVWGLCDGRRSARDIVQVLGASYPEGAEVLEQDVESVLQQLQEGGLLVVR
jgi:hypothetical protein